jgi:hypothetical protein
VLRRKLPLLDERLRFRHADRGPRDEEAGEANGGAMKLAHRSRSFSLLGVVILFGLGLFEDCRRIWRERRA